MEILKQILIVYLIGAFLTGGIVASMEKVSFNVRGKPARFPRLLAGSVAAMIWPAVIWQLLVPRNRQTEK
jgi:hypothetical protein